MDEAGGDRETTEAGIAPADGPQDEGYGAVAVGFLRAVVTDAAERLIVNTANMGRLPFLDDDAVVEAPTLVGREGCAPVAVGALLPEQRELVIRVKEVERLTLRASSERSCRSRDPGDRACIPSSTPARSPNGSSPATRSGSRGSRTCSTDAVRRHARRRGLTR